MKLLPALFTFALLIHLSLAASSLVTTSNYGLALGENDVLITWHLNYSTGPKMQATTLTLTFPLPPNSTLISVSVALGLISKFDVAESGDGPLVRLTVRNGPDGGPIALEIQYRISPFETQKFGRLRITPALCLAETDRFSADVTLPEDSILLSSTPISSYGERTVHIGSEGECIVLAYLRGAQFEVAGGYQYIPYTHYDVFAPAPSEKMRGEISDADSLADLLPTITGLDATYPHWVVVVVPPDLLSLKGEAGLYLGAGVIYLLENYNESFAPHLVHETMHGFNGQVLGWNKGASFWFEEGTADYAAHLYTLESGAKDTDMFVRGSGYYSSPYSELADYYRTGDNRMEFWNFSTLDSFSYDYSQFIIRAYVYSYGTDALRQAYACLRTIAPGTNAGNYSERNNLVVGCMSRSAGNVSVESILYPGKALFMADERSFERYAGAIGSATWKGVPKPLPASAYDLPPLPYENESKDALATLSASIAATKPFTSQRALGLYQDALARYDQARTAYQQGDYHTAFQDASYATVLLQTAAAAEQANGGTGNGNQAPSGTNNPPQPSPAPGSCLPAFALAGTLLLASWRRFS